MKASQNHKSFIFEVKVTPNAPRDAILGWEGNLLKVKIHTIPEKGKANAALVAFLAKVLGLSKSQIEIVAGAASRLKRLRIVGLSEEDVKKILPS